MKTLIVHPTDPSTEFLSPIYKYIVSKTVITGGVSKRQIIKLINTHETIILLGHGSKHGLLAVNQFPGYGSYIIDNSMVPFLKPKSRIISIWCYANQFVKYHQLKGFHTGMFISEKSEANYCGLYDSTMKMIDESNYWFSQIVARHIHCDLEIMYNNVVKQYSCIAKNNMVANYNYKRLSYL